MAPDDAVVTTADADSETFRCGYAAIVGRPNVGKSTLMNRILGHKVSIVTPRAQTTRHRILGIDTTEAGQVIYVDTPGLHRKTKRAINRMMNRAATASVVDADAVVVVVEALRWTDEDSDALAAAVRSGRPVFLAVNKVDRVQPRERLLPYLEECGRRADFAAVVPLSAQKGHNVDALRREILARMPEGPPMFPDDQLSDRGERFLVGEIIREKLMLRLSDEVPYGLTVEVEQCERDADGLKVGAVIWVEREGHKGIVIGKGGERLKVVGQSARTTMQRDFDEPVRLDLWVRVKENWTDSERDLRSLGFDV